MNKYKCEYCIRPCTTLYTGIPTICKKGYDFHRWVEVIESKIEYKYVNRYAGGLCLIDAMKYFSICMPTLVEITSELNAKDISYKRKLDIKELLSLDIVQTNIAWLVLHDIIMKINLVPCPWNTKKMRAKPKQGTAWSTEEREWFSKVTDEHIKKLIQLSHRNIGSIMYGMKRYLTDCHDTKHKERFKI